MKRTGLVTLIVLSILALAGFGYFGLKPAISFLTRTTALPETKAPSPIPADADPVESAIMRGASYIVNAQYPNGKFVYLANPNPSVPADNDYNFLRHAGTIYSLGLYNQFNSDNRVQETMRSGAKYLLENVGPVDEQPGVLAVWSNPDVETKGGKRAAKLGGAGLGLVALLSLEKISPGHTPLSTLQSLGGFIVWMQNPDGSYISRYVPDKGGKDPSWNSLYYPGEAALGLVMLYEADGDVKWLNSAALALQYLANIRSKRYDVEADHWALLATGRLFNHFDKLTADVSHKALVTHLLQIVNSMLLEQQGQMSSTAIKGCFTPDGRTCPTATRLEGLLAALPLVPSDETEILKRMNSAIEAGVAFLVESQIKQGRLAGGFPLSVMPDKRVGRRGDQSGTVRIDYVQHAMSALIMYANHRALAAE